MRVIIASTFVPGVRGGLDVMIDSLGAELTARGHEVDTLRFPFHSDPKRMLPQMLALRLHRVAEHGDRLICIRTPSYLLRHHAKTLWFIHHHRGAYDLWGTPYSGMTDDVRGRADRQLIIDADNVSLRESRAIYTNSKVVADRLSRFNGLSARVLYPPADRPERFRCDGYGDAVVYVSRLAHHKRQDLAIEAMRHVRSGVRLIVAGAPDTPAESDRLRHMIAAWGLEDRVDLRDRWISDEEKVDLMADALAVVYCPLDEDSYGYPSLEAHYSGKAVISTTDAGGVEELIVDGLNGSLTEPDPVALAARFDELYEDRALAEKLGQAGIERIRELGIDWDTVIGALLS